MCVSFEELFARTLHSIALAKEAYRKRLSFYNSTGDIGWSEVGHYSSDRRVLSPRVARSGEGGTWTLEPHGPYILRAHAALLLLVVSASRRFPAVQETRRTEKLISATRRWVHEAGKSRRYANHNFDKMSRFDKVNVTVRPIGGRKWYVQMTPWSRECWWGDSLVQCHASSAISLVRWQARHVVKPTQALVMPFNPFCLTYISCWLYMAAKEYSLYIIGPICTFNITEYKFA